MINVNELKDYMIDKLINTYTAGVNAALVDIARISQSSDEEIIEIAKSKGLDISRWEEQ